VNGETGHWIRYRVIDGGSFSGPHIDSVGISSGGMYVYVPVTQGESRSEDPLGTLNGSASQAFQLSNYPVIDDDYIKLFITESGIEYEWTRVDNFLNSIATDKHFTVYFDNDGRAYIVLGDGTNGYIPNPSGSDCRASYRSMRDMNGNLGPNEIIVNLSGVSYISGVRNVRSASGYSAAEGSTDEDLARVKIAGPASLRIQSRGVTIADIQSLVENFVAPDGTRPFDRALCIEEGYGEKTVKVVVVGDGGVAVEPTRLTEIEDYFNGDTGVLLLNSSLTAVNFTPHAIDIDATIYGGTESAALNALSALLMPNATDADGNYVWAFGDEIAVSQLITTLMNASTDTRKVTITTPSSDTLLGTEELPVVGSVTITVL
jgi:hypothetical protein